MRERRPKLIQNETTVPMPGLQAFCIAISPTGDYKELQGNIKGPRIADPRAFFNQLPNQYLAVKASSASS